MRKIIVSTFLSLDGVMQAPGGPGEDPSGGFTLEGWSVNYWDEMMGQVMGEAMSKPFDLLLGRKTYEIFAAHWPHAPEEEAAPLNNAHKYVVSTTLERADWQHSTIIRSDVVDQIRRLKEDDGPEIQVHGSSGLIQTLLAHDLVDELRIWTFPVVLGHGKRLFGSGAMPTGLRLVDAKTSTTGVTIAAYERAGAITTGTFALEQPSDAENERRQRHAGPAAHASVAPLHALAGEWISELENPLKPGTNVQGRATFEWLEGGRLLLHRTITPPPFPSSHSLIGRRDPDDSSSPYVMHYFDTRGVVRLYDMTFDGRTWTLFRRAHSSDDFDQGFRGTLSADGATIIGDWERSDSPGEPIHHDAHVTYRKVS
jgi:dihydrofolate reductase